MNSQRLLLLGAILLLLIAGSYGWRFFLEQTQSTQTAKTASIGLEGAAGNLSKTSSERITFWQNRVKNSPQDYISMTYLGQAYLDQARQTADISNYSKAEEALTNALETNPNYLAAAALLAAVRFSQHDFADALRLAERVYEQDPEALLALALMGDANLELGNYAEAAKLYDRLFAQNQSPAVLSRLARLAWLNGDVETAVSTMEQAADDAVESGLMGESLAWYQFQLGELYFNSGKLDQAQQQYARALNSQPDYYLGLAGEGKVLAAQGSFDQAILRYEQVVQIAPEPGFVAFLGDLYTVVGDKNNAASQYELIEVLAELEASQGILYNRQLVYYYANHDTNLAKAITLAETELETRQDIHAYDALAWALFKDGRYEAAATVMDQALKLGTAEAALHFHAGMIYHALNQSEQAAFHLNTALALNPYFHVLDAALAREILSQEQAASP